MNNISFTEIFTLMNNVNNIKRHLNELEDSINKTNHKDIQDHLEVIGITNNAISTLNRLCEINNILQNIIK